MSEIGDNSELIVDEQNLIRELDQLTKMKDLVSSTNGDLRSKLKEILDLRGYNKSAMAIVRQVDEMSEGKRADVLRSLLPMMEALLESRWKGDQAELPLDEDTETADTKKPAAKPKAQPKKKAAQ